MSRRTTEQALGAARFAGAVDLAPLSKPSNPTNVEVQSPYFGPSQAFVNRLANTEVLDSTLRDGAQDPRIRRALTVVENRLAVARIIDQSFSNQLGRRKTIIEGGWPGANPADTAFFRKAAEGKLELEHATLAAFGAPARAGVSPENDPGFMALLESEAPTIVFVVKGSRYQAEKVLGISGDANLELIDASIREARAAGRRVILDAEHAFDGFAGKPQFEPDAQYAMQVLRTGIEAGADTIVLCDTNGGTMPETIEKVTRYVVKDRDLNRAYRKAHGKKKMQVGIHAHDDRSGAVANTFRAQEAGAMHVQVTLNGGERLGNTDSVTYHGSLRENYGVEIVPEDVLARWKKESEKILQLSGLPPEARRPFVGDLAAATKAGLHASGSSRNRDAYANFRAGDYGNVERVLIGEMMGKDGVAMRLEQLGFPYEITRQFAQDVTKVVKTSVVHEHYDYIDGEGSFYLLALRKHKDYKAPFDFKVEQHDGKNIGILDIHSNGFTAGDHETDGKTGQVIILPDNPAEIALTLKQRLSAYYPLLAETELQMPDVKTDNGIPRVYTTAARAYESHETWTTMRPGHNIPEATAYAVTDALELAIHHATKLQPTTV